MSWLASSIVSTLVAYCILLGFLIVEPRTRKSAAARSLSAGAPDRGSTAVIGAAFGLSMALLLLSLALNALGFGILPLGAWFGWAGVVVMLVGFALRLWSTRTLGEFFTRTLLVAENQRIVREGPYRLVRHHGYLADLLLWIGAAVATHNVVVIFCICVVMALAYSYRIRREEAMMLSALGEPYAAYMAQTKRLIPLIY